MIINFTNSIEREKFHGFKIFMNVLSIICLLLEIIVVSLGGFDDFDWKLLGGVVFMQLSRLRLNMKDVLRIPCELTLDNNGILIVYNEYTKSTKEQPHQRVIVIPYNRLVSMDYNKETMIWRIDCKPIIHEYGRQEDYASKKVYSEKLFFENPDYIDKVVKAFSDNGYKVNFNDSI